jgi:hypothetical protein
MKKLFVVIALLTCIETLYGQGFQAGLRTGGGAFLTKKGNENIGQPAWSNEFTLLYESKRHFALEVSLLHSQYQQHYSEHWEWYCFADFAYPGEEDISVKKIVNKISPIISFQYKLYNKKDYYRSLDKFAASVGIHLAPTWTRTKSTNTSISDGKTYIFDNLHTENAIIVGLNTAFLYKLSYHLSLSSKFMVSTDPFMLFGGSNYYSNDRAFVSEINIVGLLGFNFKF